MSKQLVVCCDGTWNTPDEHRGVVAAPTNVAKLALGVVDSPVQALFYEPGVGTRPDDRVLGGAFGLGLSQNVRNGYRFLAERYQSGDKIFLFGFSRGAYTARSLAGLVHNCGILKKENADRVDEAFAFYRDRTSHTRPSALGSQLFRRMYSHPDDTIHFIGVWDTVGALGIPDDIPGWDDFFKRMTNWQELWGFHDTQLGPHVTTACHALAIDEQRPPFKPTLWTSAKPGQTLEQVWFAGVHSEIGGGSASASLSDIALLWMVKRARECGLLVNADALKVGDDDGAGTPILPQYAAPIVDSRKGLYAALRPYHRLEELQHQSRLSAPAPGQSLATSADRRFRERIDRYSPRGFSDYFSNLPRTQVTEESPVHAAVAP
jgi:uncharacterized protein (DUF2235 family)